MTPPRSSMATPTGTGGRAPAEISVAPTGLPSISARDQHRASYRALLQTTTRESHIQSPIESRPPTTGVAKRQEQLTTITATGSLDKAVNDSGGGRRYSTDSRGFRSPSTTCRFTRVTARKLAPSGLRRGPRGSFCAAGELHVSTVLSHGESPSSHWWHAALHGARIEGRKHLPVIELRRAA